MILTVASYKGGVGKTTTAIHLAAYLALTAGTTLLVDADAIRSATKWAGRNKGGSPPFEVCSLPAMAKLASKFKNVVMDTEGNPGDQDFFELVQGSDYLVVPAVPESTATDGLTHTLDRLAQISKPLFRVLLTMTSPRSPRDIEDMREALQANGIPVFESSIPRLGAFEKASAKGNVVSDVADRLASRCWAAYRSAGEELMQEYQESKVKHG